MTPILVAGAFAVSVAAALIALADPATAPAPPQPHQACSSLRGTQSLCESQGNVQINDSLPQVDYFPYAGGAT